MLGRMKLSERLETLDCRKDSKARRVSNVAPDKLANVTANQLEDGMTLEAIEALSVPTFAYQTQITIHGKLPAFNEAARPGGYKAVFLNGNGSVGVRYSAIDADKKALIERAARVSESGWHTARNSTGFEVSKSFRPSYADNQEVPGSREAAKQATLAALRAVPVSRFYGSAFAGVLAYGMGYYVAAEIGAVPVSEVWPLIQDLFGVPDLATLEAREAVKRAADEAKRAEWQAECDARAAKHEAAKEQAQKDLAAYLATLPGARLSSAPRSGSFIRYRCDRKDENGAFRPVRITLAKRGPLLCYSLDGGKFSAVKTLFRVWDEAAARGEVFKA